MLKINNILFPTDFSSCAEDAFAQAAKLARSTGARLHVVSVVSNERDANGNPLGFLPLGDNELEAMLDIEPIHSNDPALGEIDVVTAQLESPTVWKPLLEYVAEQDIDLIVMGTHGRRGLDRFVMGSVTELIVRRAPCPVLTVRPETAAPGAATDKPSIVVPIDFSPSSRVALEFAVQFGEIVDASLWLVHVVEHIAMPSFYSVETVPMTVPDLIGRARRALDRMAAESIRSGMRFACTVLTGHAPSDITAFTSEVGASMIVMATHGLTGVQRWLLGSVTEQVLRTAPCPVMTLRSIDVPEPAGA